MEIKPKKTVRFTQVVENAGHPTPVTLWTAPEEDREFARAMREERVLTVIQRNVGAKADYGLVGFFKEPYATYLVFPKKLPYPLETKVVAIKYDELAEPKPSGPLHKAKPEKRPGIPKREMPAKTGSAVKERAEKTEPVRQKPVAPPAVKPAPVAEPAPPKLRRFRAEVEIVARQVVPMEVEAKSLAEAARLMKEKTPEVQLSLQGATVTRRVSRPKMKSP